MGKDRLFYLLKQYTDNKASQEEVKELFSALQSKEGEGVLKNMIIREGLSADPLLMVNNPMPSGEEWDSMQEELMSLVRADRKMMAIRGLRRWPVMKVAALVAICAGIGITVLVRNRRRATPMPVATRAHNTDIAPGGNRAVLTLADGSTIVLDSVHSGTLAQQGSVKVIKLNTGALEYKGKEVAVGDVLYNTISTPNGGQYQIVLPDGSKVWLNAASSLRYPTAFDGKERVVELKGEGYFEIAHNAAQPFMVHVDGGTDGKSVDVRVLGTAFDVMAYKNEGRVNTTLVSGKVQVAAAEGMAMNLEPGRQAVVDDSTREMRVGEANIDQVVAWKNGLFRFRETGIRELMRQVERWYNVEVVYETNGKDQDFTGIVSRNEPVSVLLHTLELTGTVHFRIDGKKIIVLP
jgi:transmembrane sensor